MYQQNVKSLALICMRICLAFFLLHRAYWRTSNRNLHFMLHAWERA